MSDPRLLPRSEAFIAEIRREFPDFRIVDKRDSVLARLIDVLLKVLTFGAQRQFLSHYHTVIGNTLYVPDRWASTPDVGRLITLCHERVHLRQRRRYGDVLMALIYLVPFFPLGLAYGRARIEWEAYTETLRATFEHQGRHELYAPELRAHIVKQFTGGSYGWMWPFPRVIHRWYDAALVEIEKEAPSGS
jgi:hypothetical protein